MKKLRLTILAIVASMFASSAFAFDPADLKNLLDTNECVRCDLQESFLPNTSLNSADLFMANLRDADLSGANLRDAILGYAIMNSAILCNTTMPDGSVIYSGC